MKCSPEMQEYFDTLEKDCFEAYDAANIARSKGVDPSDKVEITLAKTLSDRVIGLISVISPQLKDTDAPERIRQLEEQYGILDWRVAFKISEEVAKEKFCKFENKKEAIETGIRVGFAYVTLGVVSAPIEGFTSLEIKKRNDGQGEYFCLNYSGPVRNAGGTAAAVSVIIGDYLRKIFGYSTYDPTDKEVARCYAEIRDYHERVTNLQYFPSEKESAFMLKNLPVEISGDPSEKFEVSNVNLKDLPRIGTNIIRSGYCLIHSSCLPLKAPKLWAKLEKWGPEFGLEHWNFLEKFIKIQKETKAGGKKQASSKISPDYTYIKDLVSGRPVLGHPLAQGAFRIRYGRARNSGYSAQAIHPATMQVLSNFVATGTQLKVERPGKAAAMAVCDSIEGPIIKLKDGSVVRLETQAEAKKYLNIKKYVNNIAEILYLGDVLINYGDFFDRAHPLVPVGYCEEIWAAEIEKACKEMFGEKDSIEKLSQKSDVRIEIIQKIIAEPVTAKVELGDSIKLAEILQVPLHPRYTYHWKAITEEQLKEFMEWLKEAKVKKEEGFKIILQNDPAKRVLELIGAPHLLVNKEYVVIEGEEAKCLLLQLGIEDSLEVPKIPKTDDKSDCLKIVNILSSIEIRDKSGTFLGTRMGRPEKAKLRKMKGSPHGLFPVGDEGGRLRSFQAAMDVGSIKSDFRIYKCENCGAIPYPICIDCNAPAAEAKECDQCGLVVMDDKCKHEFKTHREFEIDIKKYFQYCLKILDTKVYPDLIKGVRGTTSKEHHSESLVKGILRAHHSLNVNKDGTIRYDCSEIPITHFKPGEVGVPVEKLRKLGYKKDIEGKSLKDPDQVLEIKPQDIILPCCPDSPEEPGDEMLFRTANFVDDCLTNLYQTKTFYNLKSKKDLAGHYIIGLAPHTSAGMLGRIIGFSKTQGFLAHPLFHAAMRRDCDGDESCFVLLMDSFLNFSPKYLPTSRGATMDAPLVLTYLLNPAEVDDMVFNMDIVDRYPLELYEGASSMKMPWDVKIGKFGEGLGEPAQFEGMMYTHPTSDINTGVTCSAYKTLPSMEEKLKGQMELAARIRAVDKSDVARLVIEKHFIRDTKGNLRKFSQQQFRCVKCNSKFRRPPLVGKCKCGGKIIFTVSEGFITKYLEPSLSLAREFEVPIYLQQSLELLKRRVEEVFGRDKERQENLGQWFG